MKKILLCIMLFSTIAFSGCLGENISQEDINIDVKWDDSSFDVPRFDDNSNFIYDKFLLNVVSKYPDKTVYYRVYDNSDSFELTILNDFKPFIGSVKYNAQTDQSPYHITLKSLEQIKEIEVYFSLDKNFNKNDENVIRKSVFLPQRKIDIEVIPNPVVFLISKDETRGQVRSYRHLTIKNSGDVPLELYPFPHSDNGMEAHFYEFSGLANGGTISTDFYELNGFKEDDYSYPLLLNAGDSENYIIVSVIGGNTPIGTYQSDFTIGASLSSANYVYNLEDAHFKKTISLETTVAE